MAFIRHVSLVAGSAATALFLILPAQAEDVTKQSSTMAEATGTITAPADADLAEEVDASDSVEATGHVADESETGVVVDTKQSTVEPIDIGTLETSSIAFDGAVSTSAKAFFEEPEAVSTPETVAQAQDVAQVTRPLFRGAPPFYIGIGGNIGIVDSDESAVGDFAFNIISKISLGPRFSLRPVASFSEEDVSVAIPLTYNFNPINIGEFGVYPAAGVGIDIGDDIGLLVNGGVDVPISRRFTVNGQINWRATSDIGLGVSLGVAYNFPFFFE